METISYKIEVQDPYQNAYERVIMELNHRMLTREMEGIEAALKEYGYVKGRTCEYDHFQSAEEANWLSVVECQGYHVLKCGHRVPGDYFERPSYCCVCGAKVVDE